jgi:hypothetical protein
MKFRTIHFEFLTSGLVDRYSKQPHWLCPENSYIDSQLDFIRNCLRAEIAINYRFGGCRMEFPTSILAVDHSF